MARKPMTKDELETEFDFAFDSVLMHSVNTKKYAEKGNCEQAFEDIQGAAAFEAEGNTYGTRLYGPDIHSRGTSVIRDRAIDEMESAVKVFKDRCIFGRPKHSELRGLKKSRKKGKR